MKKTILIASFLVLLVGCGAEKQKPSPMPVYTPPPQENVGRSDNPGSLFASGQADFLFADSRAYRVGDIVLVRIVESTLATNKATTSAKRQSGTEMKVGGFFGKDSFLGTPVGKNPIVGAESGSSFNGDGRTTRQSTLTTTVAARIVRVLPNNVFELEGGREVRVNDENQIVVLRGLARGRDIDADNSIVSTKIADARIELYGEGILTDKQKPGWLSRILDNMWPF